MRFGKRDEEDLFDKYQNESLDIFLKFAKSEDPAHRAVLIAGGAVLLFFATYVAGFVTTFTDASVSMVDKIEQPFWFYPLRAVTTLRGLGATALILLVLAIIGLVILRSNKELDAIKSVDDRGVNYAADGTYGTAEPMTRKEAEEEYEICPIEKAEGVVLGQYTTGGRQVICLPKDTTGNRNLLILGSPGTGKSFCYVRNAIFQAILRGESVVITDPKGELYESSAALLKAKGYKVSVFNLVDPKRSNAWNCTAEIYDPETGDVADIRVIEFAEAIMKNTSEGKGDSFWDSGESNLLKAIIMFCAWRRETDLKSIYEHEANVRIHLAAPHLTPEESEEIMQVLTFAGGGVTMRERERAIKRLIELTDGSDAVEAVMANFAREASPCDMAAIYHMIITNDIKAFDEKFSVVPISHPAGIAWSIFKNGSDNTRPNMVQGLAQRLQLFQMRDIRRITTNDDIRFEDLGKEKTALFCIISDKSTAMRAITSLFFTFLFKDVSDAADRHGPENRLYVNVIADEFANLGVIPNFDVTISTVRSRKINISIILQSIMQLERNYQEAGATISSCCDTVLFLGCNDMETADFMSNLSGIASIRVLSTKDSRTSTLGHRAMMQGYQISEGDGKRNLYNPDEIRRLPREDVLIYHNGRNMLQAHRCGYIEHPYFKAGLPPAMRLRDFPLASEKYHLTEGNDMFVQADMNNMYQRNVAATLAKSASGSTAEFMNGQKPQVKAAASPQQGQGRARSPSAEINDFDF